MTRIYLVRHGATAANRETPYRIQGRGSNRPLDEVGLAQAEAAAGALASLPIAAVFTSPMLRAVQTASAIAGRFALDPETVPEITEADVGRWEGLTWDQAAEKDPEQVARFLADPGTVPYPDGESFRDVQGRVTPAILALAARHPGGRIVVVGHNVVNRAFLAPWLGVPIEKARGLRQANGGISVVVVEKDGKAVVETLNSTLHLDVPGLPCG